jgi:rhodanese-related sulfurtransferase
VTHHYDPDVLALSPVEVKAGMEAGTVLLLDVRSAALYERSGEHVPGDRRFPASPGPDDLASLDRRRLLVASLVPIVISANRGLWVGLAAGLVCAFAVGLKFRLGYDDALDVVGVHMVGGMLGALLIGVFGNAAFNSAGADGLLAGGGLALLGKQAVAVAATLGFSFLGSFALLKLVQATLGLRVTAEDEATGLDLAQHAEAGYAFSEGAGGVAPSAGHGAPAAAPEPAPPVRVPQGDSA